MPSSSLQSFLFLTPRYLNNGSPQHVTFVLGNPSADLDSFISAILYSFFKMSRIHAFSSSPINTPRQNGDSPRLYIPLLNLPQIPSSDLWRVRSEYSTALRLATKSTPSDSKELLDSLVTLYDLRSSSLFTSLPFTPNSTDRKLLRAVLVDQNALPSSGLEGLESVDVEIEGCIDHHADESFVPGSANPRIIQTGVGSCTSLVIQELRSQRLWPDSPTIPPALSTVERGEEQRQVAVQEEAELSRLALCSILIDTVNLTAEGRVSDVDRSAVSFLEGKIQRAAPLASTKTPSRTKMWDRKEFYDTIAKAKEDSISTLTIPEILERDYKEWTESAASHHTFKIGICSVVKSLTWLINKAKEDDQSNTHKNDYKAASGGIGTFRSHLHTFAEKNELDLLAVMTTSTSESSGEFQRELLLYVVNTSKGLERVEKFEESTGKELDLRAWRELEGFREEEKCIPGNENGKSWINVWWQGDVTKSRKQVAPLLQNWVRGS